MPTNFNDFASQAAGALGVEVPNDFNDIATQAAKIAGVDTSAGMSNENANALLNAACTLTGKGEGGTNDVNSMVDMTDGMTDVNSLVSAAAENSEVP